MRFSRAARVVLLVALSASCADVVDDGHPPLVTGCHTAADCSFAGPGFVCADGGCTEATCHCDEDCPKGLGCYLAVTVVGECVATFPLSPCLSEDGGIEDGGNDDGGRDAGPSDAGLQDGGIEDGGIEDGGRPEDGGTVDAGGEDAGKDAGGTVDGGKEDGGKEDGGTVDGGKEDGGKADGGKADGGKEDGGKADAG